MNDRQEKIYALVQKAGSISIEELKKEIFASVATLRRDLASMEQSGLLTRTWGGAVAKSGVSSDPPVFVRSNARPAEKTAIARLAIDLLESNSTVFLASGTTVTRLASLFYKRENLTVITNGIDAAEALKSHCSARVILTGGELYENYDLVGALAESSIDQFNADLFFFSCSGITAEGFTSMDAIRLNVIKRMKQRSARTVLLADSSKVGKKYTYRGFGFDSVDYVIMERIPDDAELCAALGSRLITPREKIGSLRS